MYRSNNSNNHWQPTSVHPYPMNFVQVPSSAHQIRIYYGKQPYLQGLSTAIGPVMYPVKGSDTPIHKNYSQYNNKIAYPTTHSIPGPFLQSYIDLPRKSSMY